MLCELKEENVCFTVLFLHCTIFFTEAIKYLLSLYYVLDSAKYRKNNYDM